MPAKFYEQEVNARLVSKRKLSAFLDELVRQRMPGVQQISLTYILSYDEYVYQINLQYLNHDTYTDIITFDLSENEQELTGEIYISTDRVRDNAQLYGTSYNNELHRVIFHGALHLCGYKDKTVADEREMRRQENICLEKYFKN